MLYSCTHMATVGFKGLQQEGKENTHDAQTSLVSSRG